jgi:hypothetical protein
MPDQETSEALQQVLSREIPIEYYGAEEVVGIFADQAIVSHSAGVFTLLFFQMQVPPPTTVEDLGRNLEVLPARCVARIVLTPSLMQQFRDAMNTNIEKYNRTMQVPSREHEE